jgi:antitoxin component YwqK of YwqJK toxin-antitoxin module
MDTTTWAFKEYYNDGVLKNETVYIKGEVLNQLRKKYDKNGKLKSEKSYIWGNKGKTKRFDKNGNEIN